MATADRNKLGKATDKVVHIKRQRGGVLCGRINYSISTNLSFEQGGATCLKCLSKLENLSFLEKKHYGLI